MIVDKSLSMLNTGTREKEGIHGVHGKKSPKLMQNALVRRIAKNIHPTPTIANHSPCNGYQISKVREYSPKLWSGTPNG
jgi:hypothetical protein